MRAFGRNLYRIFALALCVCLLLPLVGCQDPGGSGVPAEVKVMTFNVAYYDGIYTNNQHLKDLAYPGQTKEEDYTFAERADRLRVLLKHYVPDVFFLNEFNFAWWNEVISGEDAILKELTQYTHTEAESVGGSHNGEGESYLDLYSILFYNQEKFTLVDSGVFRILQRKSGWYDHCAWARLKDKATGQEAIYAATHLPTVPDNKWAVKCVIATTAAVEELAKIANGLPIILGGDFNTTTSSRGSYTHQYMVGAAGYQDCKLAVPDSDNSGTARIWGKSLHNNGSRIDYIFVNGADVKDYAVASGAFLEDDTFVEKVTEEDLRTGQYYDISDHLPVLSTIVLNGGKSVAPQPYCNPLNDSDVEATPTGSFTENGGTPEKLIFNFADALKYTGNVKQQGFEASLVQNETYGTVLKLQAADHIADGAITIDYGALMEAYGLTPVDTKEYSIVKITYLVNTSFSTDSGILRLGFLKKGLNITAETNSLSLTTYGQWTTKTLALTLLPSSSLGSLNALSIFNAEGALRGDAIYIASIEFIK